jgi:succinate dehydrogenase / fumarate reductase, cytochrome b subunit
MSVRRVFSSSVGTKLLIGATGFLLFLYLLLHLAGNLIVFAGQEKFNEYSHMLVSNPLVVPAELALLLFFLVHIYKTVTMWTHNQRARPIGYEKKEWAGYTSRKSLSSTTMIWTGLVIFVFVVIHVAQIKYGAWYTFGEANIRDLYRTEIEVFSSPVWVVF